MQQFVLVIIQPIIKLLILHNLQMSQLAQSLQNLRFIHTSLDNNFKNSQDKINTQKKIYTELYRIFFKFSSKLASLSNTINEEILTASNNEETVVQYYQILSNSLLRMADCSRKVSLRCKTEIFDPLKTFTQNYQRISQQLIQKIFDKIQHLMILDQQLIKHRESYNQANQKLEKHKEMQKKIIEKIQNGNMTELDKFNQNMKKLTENITSSEKFYLLSVEKLNHEWDLTREELTQISDSIVYNEDSRLAFFKKTIFNSIKAFEQFNQAYDEQFVKRIEETNRVMQKSKSEQSMKKKIRQKIEKITNNDARQQFISYEDLLRSRRKKNNEEESAHLVQYFSKIKDKEKKLMTEMIKPWFSSKIAFDPMQQLSRKNEKTTNLSKSKSVNVISPSGKGKSAAEKHQRDLDNIKEKILSMLPHSIYFIETIYLRISDMSSFYCKLQEDNFFFLLNAFTVITKNIDQNIQNQDLPVEFIFKMMQISQRVMLMKSSNLKNVNQPIQLLSHQYGKNSPKFRDSKTLSKILAFIEKRKTIKKKSNTQSKGMISTFTKGFFAAVTGRKNPTLNEDEQFNCLQEMITLIANFSVPNEIILPFIKEALGNSYQGSYDYLKSIILNKKDVQERQSLFYKKQIKEKKEQRMKKAIQSKKMGQYALSIIAKHGFFTIHELKLRTICKDLANIHLQILAKLQMHTEQKWIHLIPINQQLNYILMKQEVAEKSVPSSTEEIITLDVNRSLHLHGEYLNPTILHSLLRTYAFFHSDISYCQGMNYIAGYIYIKTKHEQSTYRIFQYLMETRFKEIFANEFEVLKVKMYQFQRLLSIFHPEISQHFKRQAISPECYIVSWIITLFASSYQYTFNSYLIDFLWERFIIWGWREFFRFVLWLFSLFKENLIEMTYDKALHFLGQMGRSEMFLADKQKFIQQFGNTIENPHQGIERYHVTEDLLNKFTQQYSLDK